MSDMEFFAPGEGGESYDPAAFERFKEQIKKNAAAMATAKQQEQRQKQKEDRLAKILLKFIQGNQKSGILMLAAKLLEENIPPSFILSIIILGNEDIQEELKKEIAADAAQIKGPADGATSDAAQAAHSEFSLAVRFNDQSLPLKIRAEIDEWGKGIFEAGSIIPFQVLETAVQKDGMIKQIVIDCAANVLDDFMAAVFKKLKQQVEEQKLVK